MGFGPPQSRKKGPSGPFFISVEPFHTQTDAAPIQIDTDHLDLNDVAYANYLEGVLNVTIGHLADVNQAVLLDADVDQGAEIDHIAQITITMELSSHLLFQSSDLYW